MRAEERIYRYSVKIFDVGEIAYTTSNRCPLEHPGGYTVIKFGDSFSYGDDSTVDVMDSLGTIHYGVSTEYLSGESTGAVMDLFTKEFLQNIYPDGED